MTSRLINFSKKALVYVFVAVAAYFAALVSYDLLVFKRTIAEIIITYTEVILFLPLCWLLVRLVFKLLIKEGVSERAFNICSLTVIVFFTFISIILGVSFFLEGFIFSAFNTPWIVVSVIGAQAVRSGKTDINLSSSIKGTVSIRKQLMLLFIPFVNVSIMSITLFVNSKHMGKNWRLKVFLHAFIGWLCSIPIFIVSQYAYKYMDETVVNFLGFYFTSTVVTAFFILCQHKCGIK